LETLLSALLEPAFRSFNLSAFEGKVGLEEVQNALYATAVFSDMRAVVLYPESLKGGQEVRDWLCEYTKAPKEGVTLIVFAEEADKRTALYKAFAARGKVVEFPRYNRQFIRNYIVQRLKKQGLSISDAALNLFERKTGYLSREAKVDFGYVVREAEKIESYPWPGKAVNADILESILSPNESESIFALSDAVLAGDVAHALALLPTLGQARAIWALAVSELSRTMHNILLVSSLLDTGYSEAQIAKEYSLHPYTVKKAAQAARTYRPKDAKRAIEAIAQADYLVKSGFIDASVALDTLIVDIAVKSYQMANG